MTQLPTIARFPVDEVLSGRSVASRRPRAVRDMFAFRYDVDRKRGNVETTAQNSQGANALSETYLDLLLRDILGL
jgi:hypothetical protein